MAKLRTRHVVLVRSGETEWDRTGRLQGRADLPLAAVAVTGMRAQIREAVERNGTSRVAVIVHAPDEASRATAQALAQSLPGRARLRAEDDLQAMDLGLWEGMLEQEVAERFPSAYAHWIEDASRVEPPEGEAYSHAAERLSQAVRRIVGKSRAAALALVLRPRELGLAWCSLTGRPLSEARGVETGAERAIALEVDPAAWSAGAPAGSTSQSSADPAVAAAARRTSGKSQSAMERAP